MHEASDYHGAFGNQLAGRTHEGTVFAAGSRFWRRRGRMNCFEGSSGQPAHANLVPVKAQRPQAGFNIINDSMQMVAHKVDQ